MVRAAVEAGNEDVEVAILVVVRPGHVTLLHIRQTSTAIGKGAGIVPVEPADGTTTAVSAGEEEIEVTIVVIVPPGHTTIEYPS